MKLQSYFYLLFFFPFNILAEQEESSNNIESLGYLDLLKPLVIMLLVLIILSIVAKKIQHMRNGSINIGNHIKLLAKTPLTNTAQVCLIRVGNKDFLIGVTNQNISKIHDFDTPVNTQYTPSTQTESFKYIKQLFHKNKS